MTTLNNGVRSDWPGCSLKPWLYLQELIADQVMFASDLVFWLAINNGCMQVIIFNFQKTVKTPFLVSAGFAELAKYPTRIPHLFSSNSR